jgi:methyl-accepting chemotaxis protein
MTKQTKVNVSDSELLAIYQAINQTHALIEFELDGTIITANENFLRIFGYNLEEIVGKHHRIFCEPSYAASEEYAQLWQNLGNGEYDNGEFVRFSKDGAEIWLQASYNPIFNADGDPFKIVKFASDITKTKLQNAEFEGKIQAINRAQAVLELELDGTIITANENFLRIFGYDLEEIVGKHHRIFCEPSYAASEDYAQFWQKLSHGDYFAGEVERFSKDGGKIWLQASYNPIFDSRGNLLKVFKFASNITQEVQKRSLAMLEISTPITEIFEGVLLMPIVGTVDYNRAMDIMNKALAQIAQTHARTLILDITGVALVDTAVANHLIKIAQSVLLMGGDTIISGISPAIAQTIVQLGIDLKTIKTTGTLQDAIASSVPLY